MDSDGYGKPDVGGVKHLLKPIKPDVKLMKSSFAADFETSPAPCLTVGLDVAAAPLQHPGHLSVDGVEAELGLGPPLRRATATRRLLQLQLGWVRELQRLQQARLTLH